MEAIRPLLQVHPTGSVFQLNRRQAKQLFQFIVHEWRTKPWLFERDIPPWYTVEEYQGTVRIMTEGPNNPSLWTTTRHLCNDFWFALERLKYDEYLDRYVSFSGVPTYTQRLSQTLLHDHDFLILDLRRIIGQYVHFI